MKKSLLLFVFLMCFFADNPSAYSMTDEDMREMRSFTASVDMTDKNLLELAKEAPQLTRLNLEDNDTITKKGLRAALQVARNLTELSVGLNEERLDTWGLANILDGFPNVTSLECGLIPVSPYFIGHYGKKINGVTLGSKVMVTAETFSLLPNLQHLTINRTLSYRYSKDLITFMTNNNKLLTLNIIDSNLRSDVVAPLARRLATNNTLKTLNLGFNNIGNHGAKDLAAIFDTNKTLTSLELEDNYIGHHGALSIMEKLINNKTMKVLDLRDNKLDNKTKAHIVRTLPHIKVIVDLTSKM